MNFKKSQSGRSMVEMLGVLAIIGVLSVGGIAGYSLSMRRHRANQIVDYVSKYAVTGYSKCQQYVINGGNTSIDDMTDCTAVNLGSHYADTDGVPDVGPLPSGIYHIAIEEITSDDEGNDNIRMHIEFTDQKLCQAAASIVGTTCHIGSGHPLGDSYVSYIIKQN